MRIGFDCSHYRFPGGVKVYLENLLRALTTEAPQHEYVLHYRDRRRPAAEPEVAPGSRTRTVFARAPRRLLSRLENLIGWPKIERWTGPIDIFHSPHFWLPVSQGARQVLSVHDVAYLRTPELYGHRSLNDYGYRYLLSHSLRRADAVVVPCQHTRHDLIDLCDVPEERIWVVPFGRDHDFAPTPEEQQALVRHRYQIDRPYVLYPVGTLEVRKNLPRTLTAFARAFPDPRERPLLFVTGVGAPPDDVRQEIIRQRLEDDVHIARVGYPDELRALMSGALWGLYPSLYEGFGIPPLEAMGCGLPMLVSNASSLPEVVGTAALLVDPLDTDAIAAAMGRLHEDDALRQDLARRGREWAGSEAWSWGRTARQVLAVYGDDRATFLQEPHPLAENTLKAPVDNAALFAI